MVGHLLGGVEYYLYYCTVILYGINSWFALLVLILYQVLLFVRGRAAETCVLLSTLLGRPICRPCQSYMKFFEQQCNADPLENVVKGLAILKGELPHYDVFVEASTPLGKALQAEYGKALDINDARAVWEMKQQRFSQQGW